MKKSLLSHTLQAILATSMLSPDIVFAKTATDLPPYHSTISQKTVEPLNVSINKSPTDKAIYQGIRLANGMEVLLISDESANKSLMSVGLPIGSMEDPREQQGLAHYLEHMILMGSKGFPETNSLDGFLTKNGGYNNAYTTSNRTIYYLEVNNNAFDEAVARLSDTFAAPLLLETNAKKEVNAVNAEMVRAKSSDGFLIHDVNLATSNPNHPITKFAVGNTLTLSDKPQSKLQDELVKFYQKYYSANIMKAVLYSNQPIEQLATLAEKTLGKVENKNIIPPTIDIPVLRDQDKSIIIDYKPVKPNKMLSISFDMPEDKAQFKHKSGAYLSYVFSNNSEGTLSHYLITQGLSDSGIQTEYEADNDSRNRGSFNFYIALTDKGLAQRDKIISLIFQQIAEIKQKGIQESYFKELSESLSQEFKHLQVEKSGGYVAGLASQMLFFPLEHIIDQPFMVEKMDQRAILEKLDRMNMDNARIMIVNDKAKTDKQTKYFKAPYAIHKISDTQKALWLDFSKNPALKLPDLNPYFATDFSLNKVDKSRTIPHLIEKGQGTEIYTMPSHYFANEPKANLAIRFSIEPKNRELKHLASTAILDYMNELAQSEIDFRANVAGIGADIDPSPNTLSIAFEGYTQNLAKLIHDKVQKFSQFELTQEMLIQAKQRYLEALDRQEKENALRQASSVFSNFKAYPYFEQEKKRNIIEKITLSDIKQTRDRLLNESTGLSLLSVGNLSDSQVNQLTAQLTETIKYNNSQLNYRQYLDISQSQRKLNNIKHIPHQDNALIMTYFPNDYGEFDGMSRSLLLKNIISRWYFDDLRTDKQLGYVVYASNAHIGKSYGLQFLVQSPTASTQTIMQHNERFFTETQKKLHTMSDDEFSTYRNSLLEILQHKPESLSQEAGEFKADFLRGNRKFDRKATLIEHVKSLTKQQLIEFYENAIINQQGFVFASQAIGQNEKINQPATLNGFEKVESIEALQKEFELQSY